MEHSRPLTSPASWEEIPLPDDALFPVPAPGGARPTEVMVMLPEDGYRVVMHIVASEDDAARAVALAFREARKLDGYELTVKAF